MVLIRPDAATLTGAENLVDGILAERSFRGGHTRIVVRVNETPSRIRDGFDCFTSARRCGHSIVVAFQRNHLPARLTTWRRSRTSLCAQNHRSHIMNPRILIVDDDPDALALIGMILRANGFDSIAVESGPQALAFLAHDVPDLIILDVMMPQMDGNEVCQLIREDSRTAHVPVVMLTARSATANQVEGLLAGADDYLVKPSSRDELVASVRAALARATSAPDRRSARGDFSLGGQRRSRRDHARCQPGCAVCGPESHRLD